MEEPRRDHSAIEIAAADDEASNNSSSKPCIFEVPRKFKERNPKSYIPESFSIGPLHYGKEHLRATEKIKKHYLNNLLKPTPHTTLEEFKKSILELEGRARECYAFPTDHLDKGKFVDMLILDGCFIIELLRNNEIANKKAAAAEAAAAATTTTDTTDEDDPVFSVGWVLQVLYHDLILLENQLPWFVLECLFEMTSEKNASTKSLTELAMDFFGTIFSGKALPSIPNNVEINHILDLLRNSLVSSFGTEQQLQGDWHQIPTATSLEELGISFKKSESRNLLDVKFEFKHWVLEIPPLLIQETTCEAFRNLISYEQCYPNCEPKITSYAVLLNNLINTTKDIEVLREAGVIDNWLNPDDTLEFFKNIFTDTYVKEFYYAQICEQAVQFSHRFWPRFIAQNRSLTARLYSDPITCLSGYAFYITLLQTVYTILQYQKDNPPH